MASRSLFVLLYSVDPLHDLLLSDLILHSFRFDGSLSSPVQTTFTSDLPILIDQHVQVLRHREHMILEGCHMLIRIWISNDFQIEILTDKNLLVEIPIGWNLLVKIPTG